MLTGKVKINSIRCEIEHNREEGRFIERRIFEVSIYYDNRVVIDARIVLEGLEGHDNYYSALYENLKKYFNGELVIIV